MWYLKVRPEDPSSLESTHSSFQADTTLYLDDFQVPINNATRALLGPIREQQRNQYLAQPE